MALSLLFSRSSGVCGSVQGVLPGLPPSALGVWRKQGSQAGPSPGLPPPSTRALLGGLSKLSQVIFISHSQSSRKLSLWAAASGPANWICALSPLGHTCGSSTTLCLCPFVLPSLRASAHPAFSVRGSILEKGRETLNSLLLSAASLVPCCIPPPPLRALLGGSGRGTEGGRPSLEHSWVGWTQVSTHHSVGRSTWRCEGKDQTPH